MKVLAKDSMRNASVFFIIVCSSVLIFCTACQSKTLESADGVTETSIVNSNAVNQSFDIYDSRGLNIDMETNYASIYATTESEEYEKNVEAILCKIENRNIGKGFYFNTVPQLEKNVSDKWELIEYNPPEVNYESNWALCGEENQTSKNLSQ